MEDPTHKNRRRKKDDIVVLDDDNSTSLKTVKQENTRKRRKKDSSDDEDEERQSVVSSGTTVAQPVHSCPEVLELRQYLLIAKQEKVNTEQIVINTAQQLLNTEGQLREAVARAERAENKLGSKQGDRDEQSWNELVEKVADLQNQLKKEKKRSDKIVADLTDELEKEKRRSSKRMTDLTKQLEDERIERRTSDERIDELKRKLAGYEGRERKVEANEVAELESKPVVHLKPPEHNDNIFALLDPSYEKSYSIDDATKQIRDILEGVDVEELKNEIAKYNCDTCGVTLDDKLASLNHFLSEEHIEKVRAHGAVVSKHPVKLWLTMARRIKKKTIKQTRDAAAAAKATKAVIHTVADKHNIFQLLEIGAKNSISIDEGVSRVRASFMKFSNKAKGRCSRQFQLGSSSFDCDACGIKTANKMHATTHFLAKKHFEKVRARNASVSGLAVENWLNMMRHFEDL